MPIHNNPTVNSMNSLSILRIRCIFRKSRFLLQTQIYLPWWNNCINKCQWDQLWRQFARVLQRHSKIAPSYREFGYRKNFYLGFFDSDNIFLTMGKSLFLDKILPGNIFPNTIFPDTTFSWRFKNSIWNRMPGVRCDNFGNFKTNQ